MSLALFHFLCVLAAIWGFAILISAAVGMVVLLVTDDVEIKE